MEIDRMNRENLAQTTPGGDAMEPQEMTIGRVTYEVQRVFQGNQTVMELIADRLIQNLPHDPPVDGGAAHGL